MGTQNNHLIETICLSTHNIWIEGHMSIFNMQNSSYLELLDSSFFMTGPLTMVVVNNLETAREVLVKKSKDFAGRMKAVSCK